LPGEAVCPAGWAEPAQAERKFIVKNVCGLLLIGLVLAPGCRADQPGTDQRAAVDFSRIVSGLPLAFEVTGPLPRSGEGAAATIGYRIRSVEPVARSAQGGIFARGELAVFEYRNPEQAASAWQRTARVAHPDTGLSYAWDHVLQRDRFVYHLWAACTLSEPLVAGMVDNLHRLLGSETGQPQRILSCRCGGGCRAEPGAAD